jgi:hypothetical protein
MMSECLTRVLADLSNDAPQSAFHKVLGEIKDDAKRPDADFTELHGRLEELARRLSVADDGKGGMIYNQEHKQRLCDELAKAAGE